MNIRCLILVVLFCCTGLNAQVKIIDSLTVSAYAEVFYCYDNNKPSGIYRQPFFFSHNRHDEPMLNLGLLQLNYTNRFFGIRFGEMFGSYPTDNLAAEPKYLRNLYEAAIYANLGKHVSIEGGAFSSHLGFESAIGKDNYTLTRSLVAENSPYYESGLKFTYSDKNNKWKATLLALNGWQRFYIPKQNFSLNYGHQFVYTPTENLTINSSSFLGNVYYDTVQFYRVFHDLYLLGKFNERVSVIAAFDIGFQKQSGKEWQNWYAPVCILNYHISQHINMAMRVEYYNDPFNAIVSLNTPSGFSTYGFSYNFDINLIKHLKWRNEIRYLKSEKPIYNDNNALSSEDLFFTTSLALFF